MLAAGSSRAYRRIEDALKGAEPALGMGWRLIVNGEDYSDAIEDGQGNLTLDGADGPALTLRGEIADKLPLSWEGAETVLEMHVGGETLHAFEGLLLLPEDTPLGTELGAATGGFFAGDTELGGFTEFSSARPDSVMYSVLSLLPYDLSQLEISPVASPLIYRSAPNGFSFTQSVPDVTGHVIEVAGVSWYDTARNGARVFSTPTLAEDVEPVWTFEVDQDIKREDFRPEREADRIRWVVVSRPKTSPLETEDPNEEIARVEVPGSRAPIRTRRLIELAAENLATEAYPRAYQEADLIARRYSVNFPTTYPNPLLERGDLVAVVEPGRDAEGRYVKTWVFALSNNGIRLPDKKGAYAGSGIVLRTERLSRALYLASLEAVWERPGRGVSDPDILATHGWGTPWSAGRFWINPEKITYAGVDETGFYIDDTTAGANGAGVDGGGLYFDG